MSLHPFSTFTVRATNWSLQPRTPQASPRVLHGGQRHLPTRTLVEPPWEETWRKLPAALRVKCDSLLCHPLSRRGSLRSVLFRCPLTLPRSGLLHSVLFRCPLMLPRCGSLRSVLFRCPLQAQPLPSFRFLTSLHLWAFTFTRHTMPGPSQTHVCAPWRGPPAPPSHAKPLPG